MTTSHHSIETYQVTFQDVDPSGRIHLHRLMDYAQDCDDRNCKLMGIDSQTLLAREACWLLIGNSLRFNGQLPMAGEQLIVDSWSIRLDGIRFYRGNRYYRNQRSDDSLFGTGVSEWILADVHQHRPLRPPKVLDIESFIAMSDPSADDSKELTRLKPVLNPQLAPVRFEYLVGLGDIDMNTHLHNTHYIRLALDAAARLLDLDPRRQDFSLQAFQIHYKAEIDYGDTLEIMADLDFDDPAWVNIEGRFGSGATTSFLARLRGSLIDRPRRGLV
jgi:acyl-CoA thioesterase FadM